LEDDVAVITKLLIRSGVLAGNEKDLKSDLLRIGRDPANDLVVDHIEISRNHTKITRVNDIFMIEDLNSTNGTFLNGRRITKSERLKDGDLISLGENNVFEFSSKKESAKTEKPSRPGKQDKKKERKSFFSKKNTEPELKNLVVENAPKEKKNISFQNFSKFPTWAVILLVALSFIILFCIVPLIFIEVSNQWCNLFSGFFNAISPGVCP
jgi:predicted component of type VI protein secretion system